MKKLIITLAACLLAAVTFSPAPAQTPRAWNVIYVTNSSTTVPTNFTAGVSATTNIFATYVTVLGKASPRSANTSTAYIGTTSGNDTQPFPVTAGGEVILRAPESKKFDLKDWWVDVGTGGDGITILYQ